MIDYKYVIYDENNHLFIQCWTENNTIFLTSKTDNIKFFKSLKDAQSYLDRINHCKCCFLNDNTEKEVKYTNLVVGHLKISIDFREGEI